MSKYTTYVNLNDIEKLEIYVDKCSHTAAELKTMLGCDYIINGGLYTFSTMKPNCQLKVNGEVLVNDGYNYWSLCFNDDPTTAKVDVIPRETNSWKNAIACACFKHGGIFDEWGLNNCMKNASLAYSTNRTAVGFKDGQLALYIGTDDMTPQTLYDYLNGEGWSDIIMLDGGGSTQGYIGKGKQVTSTRCVHNYICIYLKKVTEYKHGENPYRIPTRTVQLSCDPGADVKWVQYQLNLHGYPVAVDGIYDTDMLAVVRVFQYDHGFKMDGVISRGVLAALKQAPDLTFHVTANGTCTVDSNPLAPPDTVVYYGMVGDMVRWMQWMLNAHGYPVDVDGSFGPDSLAKLKAYQGDHDLETDGLCGPLTMASFLTEG